MTEREFLFTKQDFDKLRKLVNEHTGIKLSDHKQEMLYSRLSRRLRILNLKSFSKYYELLQKDGGEELAHFINAMTTNLTAFFREPHHFELLERVLLPKLLIKKQETHRLRIWSAGCASGEEAYSIAMVVKEIVPTHWDVKILATDLDSSVLAKGKKGVYEEERIEGISRIRLRRWFKKGAGTQTGRVQILPDLQELITFKHLNLMHGWPMRGPFDIIFCRNVIIYFEKSTQKILFERFANILDNESYLLIGHSENLFQLNTRFRLLQQTVYING
ncbi:protein-glutamate O-methyltransferase [Candidatus Parabeggiatoa sp. HSG14]|uniref:CheR family methyltransferase n=1 Tax=Candidatus Parabeggiatoa sp. HSG14 TaxID=3055593 RepID=UPI0025A6C874|nr:protein-glutamate O-methyltransferase [Thiotrichales bacterium HSG14]